jgi:hypothetical protein
MTDELIYKRPRVGDFHVHRVLHDLQEDEELFQEFMVDPDKVLSAYPIDDEARRLIGEKDFAGLVARGIHPIMIVQFQRHIEWGMKMSAAKLQ